MVPISAGINGEKTVVKVFIISFTKDYNQQHVFRLHESHLSSLCD